ncbi:hypothetical protein [Streptomyces sp. NPDC007369]|uniref:hypothetical protein n=1 Tax=Streptomyces sp. NPDC007369 TaxID=3154589 RepID=UPI0033E1FBFE
MADVGVLLPLHLYSVGYEVARARPIGRIEALVLRAAAEARHPGGADMAGLRRVFELPERMLREALAELAMAGLVELRHDREDTGSPVTRYSPTDAGLRAAATGRAPSDPMVVTRRTDVLRERLTGGLAHSTELFWVTAADLGDRPGTRIRRSSLAPRFHGLRVNAGVVEPLLPLAEEKERIRRVEPAVRIATDFHYLAVRANVENAVVHGLPERWGHLVPLILDEVRGRRPEFTGDADLQRRLAERPLRRRAGRPLATAARVPDGRRMRVPVRPQDVAVTTVEADRLVTQVLAAAREEVLIVAGRLDRERAVPVRDALAALRRRGTGVTLLWSRDPAAGGAHRQVEQALSPARATPGSGRVVLVHSPAPVEAELVLAATARGPRAVLGTALFRSPLGAAFAPAVRLAEPEALGTLARLCAGWWEERDSEKSTLPAHTWQRWAARWAETALERRSGPGPAVPEGCGWAELLIGRGAGTARARALARPTRRLLLADARFDVDRLAAGPATDGVRARTEEPPLAAARRGPRFTAIGGTDGWRLLRQGRASAPPWPGPAPSPYRVTAVTGTWVVEHTGGDRIPAALSFVLRGSAAADAWARTARPDPTGDGPEAGGPDAVALT